MNEAERRAWLATLRTPQLWALCHVAGIYDICLEWSRAKMIENLCLVERIEIPQATA
jgi:hypothetical protein